MELTKEKYAQLQREHDAEAKAIYGDNVCLGQLAIPLGMTEDGTATIYGVPEFKTNR